MNISDIILYLVILLLPVLSNAGRGLLLKYEQSLPANQHVLLDMFSKRVVQSLEQQFPSKPGVNKKSMAVTSIQTMFKNAKLESPPQWEVELAIESAVHAVKQLQAPPPEQPKDPVILSTGPLPIPPVAPQAPTA